MISILQTVSALKGFILSFMKQQQTHLQYARSPSSFPIYITAAGISAARERDAMQSNRVRKSFLTYKKCNMCCACEAAAPTSSRSDRVIMHFAKHVLKRILQAGRSL